MPGDARSATAAAGSGHSPHALDRLRYALRQWLHPAEFRIASPAIDWTDAAAALAALTSDAGTTGPGEPDDEQRRLFKELGNDLWRATQSLLARPGTDEPRPDASRTFRHVDAVERALREMGLLVRDHTGEPWLDGRHLQVIAFQPAPDLARETIIETFRPTIAWRGSMLQEAQVIVGTPTSPPPGPPAAASGTTP